MRCGRLRDLAAAAKPAHAFSGTPATPVSGHGGPVRRRQRVGGRAVLFRLRPAIIAPAGPRRPDGQRVGRRRATGRAATARPEGDRGARPPGPRALARVLVAGRGPGAGAPPGRGRGRAVPQLRGAGPRAAHGRGAGAAGLRLGVGEERRHSRVCRRGGARRAAVNVRGILEGGDLRGQGEAWRGDRAGEGGVVPGRLQLRSWRRRGARCEELPGAHAPPAPDKTNPHLASPPSHRRFLSQPRQRLAPLPQGRPARRRSRAALGRIPRGVRAGAPGGRGRGAAGGRAVGREGDSERGWGGAGCGMISGLDRGGSMCWAWF